MYMYDIPALYIHWYDTHGVPHTLYVLCHSKYIILCLKAKVSGRYKKRSGPNLEIYWNVRMR